MKLSEIVASLSRFNAQDTIYAAEPWGADCEALVAREPEEGTLPAPALEKRMAYFLEVFVASEFLEGWMRNEGRGSSLHEQCARLIRYAKSDA